MSTRPEPTATVIVTSFDVMGWGLMASRAEIYRAHATECDAAAKTAPDEKTKTTYLDLAKRWRDLARQVDTLEREPPKPRPQP
jgi:hypothetical protein